MTDMARDTFRALADPTRRRILEYLGSRDMTIGEVAKNFEMTRAAVKKHLRVLEEGGMISVQPRGRERVNALNPAGLKSAAEWLNHFSHLWDRRLAKLKTAIDKEASEADGT